MVNKEQPYAGDTKSSPIIACITATVVSCILAAGIIISRMPGPAPLWGSVLWVCIAAVLTLISIVLLMRKKPFARTLFFKVAKWVFLYFLLMSAMGEYVIVFDGTRGESLVIMTIILLLFLVNVPMLWGFSVARHERNSD